MSWSRTLKIRQVLRAQIESGEKIALLFSDLRGFSAYTAVRGDEAAFRLSRQHEGILRDRISEYGILVKSLGDGVMAAFEQPIDAFRAAVAIQRAAREENRKSLEHPMDVGIGISSGTPVMTDIDFIGHSVNVAQRLSSLAKGGQILTNRATAEGVSLPEGLRYLPTGTQTLRGIGTEDIIELGWLPEVARISDGRDRMTWILTREGYVVIEQAKDRKQSVREVLDELRGARAEDDGWVSAWLQRSAAGLLRRVLERGAPYDGPREYDLRNASLFHRRGGLHLRSHHGEAQLQGVRRSEARRFRREAQRLLDAA